MSDRFLAIMHFYRAAASHSDVWRQRLDTTTNWAVVTNVGVISFAFGAPETPHFILLMLFVIDLFFLLMESRRYQVYDLWQARLRVLQQFVFARALQGDEILSSDTIQDKLTALGQDLGHTVPRLGLFDAVGFRIRRHYVYIFLVTLGAWTLKLYIHPTVALSPAEYIERAEVGAVSGLAIVLVVVGVSAIAVLMAARAPTEQMVEWRERPSPLRRLITFRWFERPPATDETVGYPRPTDEGGRVDLLEAWRPISEPSESSTRAD